MTLDAEKFVQFKLFMKSCKCKIKVITSVDHCGERNPLSTLKFTSSIYITNQESLKGRSQVASGNLKFPEGQVWEQPCLVLISMCIDPHYWDYFPCAGKEEDQKGTCFDFDVLGGCRKESVYFKREKAMKTVFSSPQCNLTVLEAGLSCWKSWHTHSLTHIIL
jgi:hypothetical protein